MSLTFGERKDVFEIEEGKILQPKFDEYGLIPVITSENSTGNVLMHGYMNKESLSLSIETGLAHYWSRSRKLIWKKGESSGLYQKIVEMKIDDDQDCVWISVNVSGSGASCHVGYKSCFYRKIIFKKKSSKLNLEFTEEKKLFDPDIVYPNAPNPTKI
tara:strand:- start:430 stop:903 length:474 start_codon:yes stop_codon:yes gene_type:complete